MKAGSYLIFLSLSLAVASKAQPAEPVTESNDPLSRSAVRERIVALLKQDAMNAPVKSKDENSLDSDSDSAANDQSVAEGVLDLDPITVTQKKAIDIPLRINRISLKNFFYGDGTIAESASRRVSLSAGPYGKGLAAIKFTLKF